MRTLFTQHFRLDYVKCYASQNMFLEMQVRKTVSNRKHPAA